MPCIKKRVPEDEGSRFHKSFGTHLPSYLWYPSAKLRVVPICQALWYNVQEDSNKVCVRLLLDVFFIMLKDRQ